MKPLSPRPALALSGQGLCLEGRTQDLSHKTGKHSVTKLHPIAGLLLKHVETGCGIMSALRRKRQCEQSKASLIRV